MIARAALAVLGVAALGAVAQEIQKRGKTSYPQCSQGEIR